ncbi:DUF1410 domain-containing protein [Mesomycoplasma hyorhinis]|uniref:DUF1410 domain-containing protein n=1 Tax=Mesomycoplasma hyorhinis TaxID=2100 RepID=UPI001C041221|nr:DUF1410 domain-containing protein [Mesomycoplasma hyorhinis]
MKISKKSLIILLASASTITISSLAIGLGVGLSKQKDKFANLGYQLEYSNRQAQDNLYSIFAKVKLDSKYKNQVVFAKFVNDTSLDKIVAVSVDNESNALVKYPIVESGFTRVVYLLSGLYVDNQAKTLIKSFEPEVNLKNIIFKATNAGNQLIFNPMLSANEKFKLTFKDKNNAKETTFEASTNQDGVINIDSEKINLQGNYQLVSAVIAKNNYSLDFNSQVIEMSFFKKSNPVVPTSDVMIQNDKVAIINKINTLELSDHNLKFEANIKDFSQLALDYEVVLTLKNQNKPAELLKSTAKIMDNKLVFTFDNLTSNTSYQISNISYKNDYTDKILLDPSINKTFITNSKPLDFDFSNFALKIKDNHYKVNIKLSSKDNLLEANQAVNVVFTSEDKTLEHPAKITQDSTNDYKIELELDNLQQDQIYSLEMIKLALKPTKALKNLGKAQDNVIYNAKDDFDKISFINEKWLNITLTREVDPKTLTDKHSSYKIKLNFSKITPTYLNHKIALEYQSKNNDLATTSEVEIKDSSTLDYTLDLNNLVVNKEYELKFLILKDTNNKVIKITTKDLNLNDSLKILQTFSNFQIKSRTINSLNASVDINTDLNNSKVDFSQNKQVKVFYQEVNNSSNTHQITGTIKDNNNNNNKKQLDLTFNNLELNKKYKITKLEVTNSANDAHNNIVFNLFTPWELENQFEVSSISDLNLKTGQLDFQVNTNIDLTNSKYKLMLKNQNNQQVKEIVTNQKDSITFNKQTNIISVKLSSIFNQEGKYLIEKLLIANNNNNNNFTNAKEISLSNKNKILDIQALDNIASKVKQQLEKLSDKSIPSLVNVQTVSNLVDEKYKNLLQFSEFQNVNNQNGSLKLKYNIEYLANTRYFDISWSNLNKIIDDKELNKHWIADATQYGSWWLQYYKPENVFANGYYWFAWPGSADIKFYVKPRSQNHNFVGQIKLKFKNHPDYFWPAKAGADKYIKDPFIVNVTNKNGTTTKLSIKQQPILSRDKSMVTYTFDVNDYIKNIEIVFPNAHNVAYVSIFDIFLTTTQKDNV